MITETYKLTNVRLNINEDMVWHVLADVANRREELVTAFRTYIVDHIMYDYNFQLCPHNNDVQSIKTPQPYNLGDDVIVNPSYKLHRYRDNVQMKMKVKLPTVLYVTIEVPNYLPTLNRATYDEGVISLINEQLDQYLHMDFEFEYL